MTDSTIPGLLARIQRPTDVAGLSADDLRTLAADLRTAIIDTVSKNGGHLAPSLGVVELTLAMLSTFDPGKDKVVWDVGHQAYAWKLLTGRAADFHTLRRRHGISGFPKPCESEYDHFGVGHSSTSISAALGIPALFWGTLMAFASLVPVVGTGLVWVPAVCYLLLTSQWESALFLSLWCGIVVVGADSILRPYFMRGGVGMPVFFIFLSILGGVKAFGMLGILDGPLILSFTVVMLSLYGDEYRDILDAGSLAHSRGAECEKGEASEEGPDGT